MNSFHYQRRDTVGDIARSPLLPGLIAVGLVLLSVKGYPLTSDAQTMHSKLAEIRALDQGGRFDEAIREYRELLHQYPESTEVRLGMANDLARTDKCEDSSESADPGSGLEPAALEIVTGICDFRRNEISAAVSHLTKATELAPVDRQAAIFLARAHAESGNPGEGVRVLKALKEGRDDPDVLYWTGVFYDQLAQQAYDAMAKSHPDSRELLETEGDQLVQQQKYDAAVGAYQKALSAGPDAPGLHFDLGNAYWHLARLDEAAAELSEGLKLNPNHAQANYELGDIAVKQGDIDRGMGLLRKALNFDPGLVEAHRSLGRAYIARQNFGEALREFSIVAKAQPSDHTIHALLASVYQRLGRKQEAEEETRKYNELAKQQMNDLQQKEAEQAQDAKTPGPHPQR
jgi:Flp pilus assembly protein TadD